MPAAARQAPDSGKDSPLVFMAAIKMLTNGPYLLNTSTDRSGLVVVFAAVGVCWSVTVLVARLAGSVSRRRALGSEDGGIIVSTVSLPTLRCENVSSGD